VVAGTYLLAISLKTAKETGGIFSTMDPHPFSSRFWWGLGLISVAAIPTIVRAFGDGCNVLSNQGSGDFVGPVVGFIRKLVPAISHEITVIFLGTLFGVLVAFLLERLWERRQSKDRYAQQLSACQCNLGLLQSTCKSISKQLGVGIVVLDLDAPALRALMTSPLLHAHASHVFIMALMPLSAGIAALSNVMTQLRMSMTPLSEVQQSHIKERLDKLAALIHHVQELIVGGLHRLGYAIRETPEDKKMLDDLNKILRGEK
jgi:hypothetical protein